MTSEQRSCLIKVRHLSQHAACKALHVTMLENHCEPGELQVYLCRFCKGWHVGHVRLNPAPMRRLARSK